MKQDLIIKKIHRVILVGKKEYPELVTNFAQFLTSNELIFSLSGKSKILFNGKTLIDDKDTVRFLPKGEAKEYLHIREEPGDCIVVYFDTESPFADEALNFNIKNIVAVRTLFKKMFSVWTTKDYGYYYESLSILYKIFSELQKENYIPEKQYNCIKPAIQYINENFLNEKISVSYLAKICNISESYLKKTFIKRFSAPPHKYIIQLKINYACDLLSSGLYNVTQTAEICGYNNIYFFSRQFKEYAGTSPTTFIKKYISSK